MTRAGRSLSHAGIAVAVMFAIGTDAATLTIGCEFPEGTPRAATLSARSVSATSAVIDRAILIPGVVDVALPSGLWETRIIANGVWAPTLYIRDADSTTVQVLRAVPLHVAAKPITPVDVAFTNRGAGPSGEALCEGGTCWIPAGVYDLRLSSTGLAPEFLFGVSVPAEGKMIAVQFVGGASLWGTVETSRDTRTSVEGAEVSLAPPGGAPTQRFSVRTNTRGFFQFKGVVPGDYALRASKGGDFYSQTEDVRIVAGVAAHLNRPLRLATPKRLVLSVLPTHDPRGKHWLIRVLTRDVRLNRLDLLAESLTSVAGEWTHERILPGEYNVQVLTSNGDRWMDQNVTVEQRDVTLALSAPAAHLTGVVMVGDHPLQAILSFDDEWGVKLHSDADGRFAGEIAPRSDLERFVLVEAESPSLRRTVRVKIEKSENGGLYAAIKLPAATLRGRVVNGDRAPQAHAIVTLSSDKVHEQGFARSDGTFEMAGFEPGAYRATADVFEHSSRPVAVELTKDEAKEIELVVEPFVRVRGHITVGDTPAIAAEIYALSRDAWGPTVPHSRSDASGYFELELPPGTTVFDGVAVHPSFDIVVGRSTIQKEKQLHLRTQAIGGSVTIEGTSLDAVLLMHNGAAITGRWLTRLAGGDASGEALTIPRLQPGHYAACLKKCVEGDLAPFGTLRLKVAD